MDPATKENLTNRNVWARLLYMILFAIAYVIAETIVFLISLFQFLTVLFTAQANVVVLRFGTNLSAYIYQILQFLTFNDESLPFPFSDWPDLEPGGTQWLGRSGGTDAPPSSSGGADSPRS